MKFYWGEHGRLTVDLGGNRKIAIDSLWLYLSPGFYGGAWVALIDRPFHGAVLTETWTASEVRGYPAPDHESANALVRLLDSLVREGHLSDDEADEIAAAHPVLDGWTCSRHPRWNHFLAPGVCSLCAWECTDEDDEKPEDPAPEPAPAPTEPAPDRDEPYYYPVLEDEYIELTELQEEDIK